CNQRDQAVRTKGPQVGRSAAAGHPELYELRRGAHKQCSFCGRGKSISYISRHAGGKTDFRSSGDRIGWPSLLLAQSGRGDGAQSCPLSGVKRILEDVFPATFSVLALLGQARAKEGRAFASFPDRHQRDGVYQAVRENKLAVARDRGVAHDIAAARNRPSLEFRSLRIKAHDHVRCGIRLAVPDDVGDRRNAVGFRLRPTRRLPFADLAGRWIKAPQVAASEIGIPNDIVASDGNAAWAAGGIWQQIFANLQRLRIDAADFVSAKFIEEHHALGIDSHAIGTCALCRRRQQLDFARFRIEPTDAVGILHREPENARAVEDESMRIMNIGVWHLVFADGASFRVKLTNQRASVAGVPDVAVLILDQAVWPRMRSFERVFLDLA